MKALAAAVLLLCAAAARTAEPPRDDMADGFNTAVIDGLKAARALWQPDACLSSGWASYRPGYKDIERMAGGIYFSLSFYSASHPSAFYHYHPPFQPDEAGGVKDYDRKLDQEQGEVDGPERCIADMPVPLRKAVAAARKAGLPSAPDMLMEAGRVRLRRVSVGAWKQWYALAGREAESWVLITCPFAGNGFDAGPGPWEGRICKDPSQASTVIVDARTGKVIGKHIGDPSPAVDARR